MSSEESSSGGRGAQKSRGSNSRNSNPRNSNSRPVRKHSESDESDSSGARGKSRESSNKGKQPAVQQQQQQQQRQGGGAGKFDGTALVPDFVHGYAGSTSRENLFYLKNGHIVYHSAALGIVFDPVKRTQRLFAKHTDDILCLAVHPNGTTVATGEIGKAPKLIIWDTADSDDKGAPKLISIIHGFHSRGIGMVYFNPAGNLLMTSGLDDERMIAVYDWAKGSVVASGKGHNDSIFAGVWTGPKTFCTGGIKHIKFWTMEGSKLTAARGQFGSSPQTITALCVAPALGAGVVLAGALTGELLVFKGDKLVTQYKAHGGPLNALMCVDQDIASGGKDGNILLWSCKKDGTLEIAHRVSVGNFHNDISGQAPCIKSLGVYKDGSKTLVGTAGCDILEYEFATNKTATYIRGHEAGEIWGLDTHPSKPFYATVSDDRTVRLWDIAKKAMIRAVSLKASARSCGFSPDGKLLAVGLIDGSFTILETSSLSPVHSGKDRKEKLCDIKFSPDGTKLAIGSNDNFIDVYAVPGFKKIGACSGASSFITHLDWSQDSRYILSNDGSHTQLYFDVNDKCKRIASPPANAAWATFTGTLDKAVSGIWPKGADKTDINAGCRSRTSDSLYVTGDDFGTVKLFAWPPMGDRAKSKIFHGHSAHVTNVRFTNDDSYVISVGGGDQTVIQWRVSDGVDSGVELDEGSLEDDRDPDVARIAGASSYAPRRRPDKPEKSTRKMPTADDVPKPREAKPMQHRPVAGSNLKLDFVHGYRANDAQNNLFINNAGYLVYHTAAVGIVCDPKKRMQRHFQGHDDDIICLAIHPNRTIVATGQVGKDPKVCVWDSSNLNVLSILSGHHQRGVLAVAFSPDGKYLATVGLDDNHTLVLYDWARGAKIAEAKGGKELVMCVGFNPKPKSAGGVEIFTAGIKNIKCHVLAGTMLDSQSGVFGDKGEAQSILAIAFTDDGRCIAAGSLGNIYFFTGSKLTGELKQKNGQKAHDGPCMSIFRDDRGLISGGKDGKILFWGSENFDLKGSISVPDQGGRPVVRAIDRVGDRVIIGTIDSDIFEFSDKKLDKPMDMILTSHAEGELWGLTAHPSELKFATCGYDNALRIWDVNGRKQLAEYVFKGDNDLRSCDWDASGDYIAVGTLKGKVYILEAKNIANGPIANATVGKQDVSVVKYDPRGKMLACGTRERVIVLLDAQKGYARLGQATGHSSSITALDWSIDGQFIQSNDSAHERLFWSNSGKRITRQSDIENIKWNTFTCTIADEIKGIWQKGMDKTDINAVARAAMGSDGSGGNVCAIGDDFGFVRLFQFPCPGELAKSKKYVGHSAHVTNVVFTADNNYVISVGGADLSIFQWKVIPDDVQRSDDDADEKDSDLEKMKTADFLPKGEKRAHEPARASTSKGGEASAPGPAPERAKPAPRDYSKVPQEGLTLSWLYGYRGSDCLRNLFAKNSGELVYNAAGLAVSYVSKKHTQQFFDAHTDDVVSIACHPNGDTIATGQVGKKPNILVWSEETHEIFSDLKDFHARAVIALDFSKHDGGRLLASVGLDDDHCLAVYDWKESRRVADAKGHKDKILICVFNPVSGGIVTAGDKHISFWTLAGNTLVKAKGVFGKSMAIQTIAAVSFDKAGNTYTGGSEGAICQWVVTNGTPTVTKAVVAKAHEGPIFSLEASPDGGFASGGKDGYVRFWDANWKAKGEVLLKSCVGVVKGITAIAFQSGSVYVGTRANEVHEINGGRSKMLIAGHYEGELWGLATHPSLPRIASSSQDKTIRLWDTNDRKLLSAVVIPEEGRSLAFSHNGKWLAVGYGNGAVSLRNAETLEEIVNRRHCKEQIGDLKFTPDDSLLVVGSNDNFIDVYKVDKELKRLNRLTGHSSYVTHVDVAGDGLLAVSNSGAKEVLFWDLQKGTRVTTKGLAEKLDWDTFTCVLGNSVSGIWQAGYDVTDVNALDRSHSGKVCVVGNDFGEVTMYSYPCTGTRAVGTKHIGHSAHVTNVRFSYDDSLVISAGGADMCLMQWKVGAKARRPGPGDTTDEDALDRSMERAEPVSKKGSTPTNSRKK